VWLPQVTGYLGYAYSQVGRIEEGLSLLERANDIFKTTREWPFCALLTVHRGTACMLAGRLDAALELGHQALSLAREHGERGHEAWAQLLLGEIASHRDPSDVQKAEDHYRQALALATELGMRPLVAHCHHGLGKLYRRTRKSEQAREQLITATTMYSEMDMRHRLKAEAEGAERLGAAMY
jgi:tetratricopeptide (TPR) repeat protein